jgi:hypothetical protein
MAATQQPTSQPIGVLADAVARAARIDELAGSRRLLSDMRTTFLLVDEARHRTIARLFAIPKDQENLLTLVVALMLAEAASEKLNRFRSMPGVPSLGDGLLGLGSLREVLCGVAGPASRETPTTAILLMGAVLAGGAGPAVVKSLHGLRSSSHRASVGFHHRYGYLVDPGHWRQRRANRRDAAQR